MGFISIAIVVVALTVATLWIVRQYKIFETMGSHVEQKPCMSCAAPTRKVCSRCKQTPYCSAEHQKKHWKQHRQDCIPHGAEVVKKGILLPSDSSTPQIVHVACKVLEAEDDGDIACHWICHGQFIGHGDRVPLRNYTIQFERFGPPSKRLDNYLQLIYNDTFAIDGSRPNKCVHAIAPNAAVDWRDSLLVMKVTGQLLEGEYEDVSPADIEPVKAYLARYRDG